MAHASAEETAAKLVMEKFGSASGSESAAATGQDEARISQPVGVIPRQGRRSAKARANMRRTSAMISFANPAR
jgi:hypothetical protein